MLDMHIQDGGDEISPKHVCICSFIRDDKKLLPCPFKENTIRTNKKSSMVDKCEKGEQNQLAQKMLMVLLG